MARGQLSRVAYKADLCSFLKPQEVSRKEKETPRRGSCSHDRSRGLVGYSATPYPDLISLSRKMLGLSALVLDICVGTTRVLGASRI
jgi:hypothetical protein